MEYKFIITKDRINKDNQKEFSLWWQSFKYGKIYPFANGKLFAIWIFFGNVYPLYLIRDKQCRRDFKCQTFSHFQIAKLFLIFKWNCFAITSFAVKKEIISTQNSCAFFKAWNMYLLPTYICLVKKIGKKNADRRKVLQEVHFVKCTFKL